MWQSRTMVRIREDIFGAEENSSSQGSSDDYHDGISGLHHTPKTGACIHDPLHGRRSFLFRHFFLLSFISIHLKAYQSIEYTDMEVRRSYNVYADVPYVYENLFRSRPVQCRAL